MKTATRLLLCFVVTAWLGLAGGCSSSEAARAARGIFETQSEALSRGDVKAYMETVDPNCPKLATIREMANSLASKRVDPDIVSLEVVSESADRAEVRSVLAMRSAAIADFRPYTVTSLNTLKKINGKWFLSDATAESNTFN